MSWGLLLSVSDVQRLLNILTLRKELRLSSANTLILLFSTAKFCKADKPAGKVVSLLLLAERS
jgi:hypothetical protein